jgi:hypothetical protein
MFFCQLIQLKRLAGGRIRAARSSKNAALTIPQGHQSNAAS